MSSKMTCPGCGAHSSGVLIAYRDASRCPFCGLSAAATGEIVEVRRRCADADVARRYTEAAVRADRAEARNRKLEAALTKLRRAFDEVTEEVDS